MFHLQISFVFDLRIRVNAEARAIGEAGGEGIRGCKVKCQVYASLLENREDQKAGLLGRVVHQS